LIRQLYNCPNYGPGTPTRSSWWATNEHRFALGILAVMATVFSICIYRLPLSAYVEDLNVDDSFYYYVIARNFARGLFSTFDGINRTNGYHPLFAWLLIPVFALIKDPVTAIRVAKLEEIAFLAIAAAFAMIAGQKAGWRLPATLIIPVVLFSKSAFYPGVEVSVLVVLLSALMLLLCCLFQNPNNPLVWAGVAVDCALLPWARLEGVAASLTAAGLILGYLLWRRVPVYRGVIAVWAASIGGIVVYFIYNRVAFGTMVPVSGQMKSYWSQLQFAQEGGFHLARNVQTFLVHRNHMSLAVVLCLGIVALSWCTPGYRHKTNAANHSIDAFVLILAASYAARLAFSMVSLNIIYDTSWYYAPAYLLLILMIPLAISRYFMVLPERGWEFLTATAALAAVAVAIYPSRQLAIWQGPVRSTWGEASYEGAEWMNVHLPPGAVIGSSDSGIIGYFSNHTVVNLDGLVNSKQYLSAVKHQSVQSFIEREHVEYLANAMWTNVSGCSFMTAATVQSKPLTDPCRPIYMGDRSWDTSWDGKVTRMRFEVLGPPKNASAPANE
jgi:hypothetical protein